MVIAYVPLEIANVGAGMCVEAINKALVEIGKDMIERNHDDGARKVVVEITVKGTKVVDQPEIGWKVGTKFPPYEGAKMLGTVVEGGIRLRKTEQTDFIKNIESTQEI